MFCKHEGNKLIRFYKKFSVAPIGIGSVKTQPPASKLNYASISHKTT